MRLAKFGNDEAMTELGSMYLNGDGVEKNGVYAERLFKRAALDGYTKAKCNLALVYLKGLSGFTRYRKAYELYKEAAEQGSPNGMYGVGYMLYRGIGVCQSYDKAVEYLKHGAEKKHAGCCFLLATHYANGYNEASDFSKAEKYLELASEYGNDQTVGVTQAGYLDSLRNIRKEPRKIKASVSDVKCVLDDTERESVYMEELLGEWRGKLYTFDWSATKILKTEDMSCRFEAAGDSVALFVYIGDSLQTVYTPMRHNNFYVENRRKSYHRGFEWLITKSHFTLQGDKLCVSVRSLSCKNRALRKPVVFDLTRVKECTVGDDGLITSISSVLYDGSKLNIDFEAQRRSLVRVSVYRTDGTLVKSPFSVVADVGENHKDFSVFLPQGVYVVELEAPNSKETRKLMVK